ncbi:hypothetical protein ACKFKF_06580 [Phormidesmis sp. 146-12]
MAYRGFQIDCRIQISVLTEAAMLTGEHALREGKCFFFGSTISASFTRWKPAIAG